MLGAIAGDIIGSIYEARPIKTTVFPLFDRLCHPTDDTVLTVALADSILTGKDYVDNLKVYFHHYPHAGYGGTFIRWALSLSRRPYNSWGNGSAMRVSPVGFAYGSLDEVREQARKSAEVTHNHAEGKAPRPPLRRYSWPERARASRTSRNSWRTRSAMSWANPSTSCAIAMRSTSRARGRCHRP